MRPALRSVLRHTGTADTQSLELPVSKESVAGTLFIVVQRFGTRDGGSEFLRWLTERAKMRGWEVVVACEHNFSLQHSGEAVITLPGIFSRSPRHALRKLRDWKILLHALRTSKRSGAEALIVVSGDLPRLSYLLAQNVFSLIFLRQDLILTCPANNRHLRKSGTICSRKMGLGCLKVNKLEACLADLSMTNRLGRIFLRWRDNLLLSYLRRPLYVSQYASRMHTDFGKSYVYPFASGPRIQVTPHASRFRLLFLGRLETVKGPEDALKILALLPVRYTLDLAGSGPLRSSLADMAEKMGLSNRVTFHGWVDPAQRRDLLSRSGTLLFPSKWAEAFGLAGIEALAAGVPVAAYDVGGVREWCFGGGARMVPCGQTALMAEAVLSLTGEHRSWNAARLAAQEHVAKHFSEERQLARLERLIPELRAPETRFDTRIRGFRNNSEV